MKEAIISLPILSLIGIINGLIFYLLIKRVKYEEKQTKLVSPLLRRGATLYQKKQYGILLLTTIILAAIIGWQGGLRNALAFMTGVVFTLLIGLISLSSSLASGGKLAQALSSKKEEQRILSLIFKGGMLPTLWLSSLALIVLSIAFYLFQAALIDIPHIISFSLGACFSALLARIAGGLLGEAGESEISLITQGKAQSTTEKQLKTLSLISYLKYHINGIEARGADFFDSLITAVIVALILGSLQPGDRYKWMVLPFLLLAAGFVSFMISVYLLRLVLRRTWKSSRISFSIIISIILLLLAYALVRELKLPDVNFYSIIAGISCGLIIILISGCYIKGAAIKAIAQASKTGAATNIITGLAAGMKSIALPVLLLGGAVYASYRLSGFYGISLTAISLSSLLIMASALNAWGSIALGSLRIARKSKGASSTSLEEEISESSYTSISHGRGLSIAAASLISYALFAAFMALNDINIIDITRAEVVIGLFVGAIMPFLVASLAIIAVVKVRQRLKERIKMLTLAKEESRSQGDIFPLQIIRSAHSYSLKQVIAPTLILIAAPLCLYPLFGLEGFAGFLAGAIFSGILLAFFLNYGGTSWESAVQYIEKIYPAGRQDDSLKASLVGRLIGNPLQEVAGPLMNILLKFIPLLCLLLIFLIK